MPSTTERRRPRGEAHLFGHHVAGRLGGPNLAAHAFRAGLVDECHLILAPIVAGGGTRALPDDVSLRLELVDERRFGNGMVHLRYDAATLSR